MLTADAKRFRVAEKKNERARLAPFGFGETYTRTHTHKKTLSQSHIYIY